MRIYVASNPHTPVLTLTELAEDKVMHVAFVLTQNPRLPLKVLKSLINDGNKSVSTNAEKFYRKRLTESIEL